MQYLTKKKLFVLTACTFMGITGFTQTLISYGNSSTGKDEFLRAYNKNKQNSPDKEKAMRDYLELYIRYKLKVRAALDMQLDTLPNQRSELPV